MRNLEQVFLPLWNERFRYPPQLAGDAYRFVPKGMNLDSVFSIRVSRTVSADYRVRWEGEIYRIEREQNYGGHARIPGASGATARWKPLELYATTQCGKNLAIGVLSQPEFALSRMLLFQTRSTRIIQSISRIYLAACLGFLPLTGPRPKCV